MVDLGSLVQGTKLYLKKETDDKVWCEPDELMSLLKAGAKPIHLNEGQGPETYYHAVLHNGIQFVNTTTMCVPELDEYLPIKNN